jgi:hypothetical protein
VPQKGSWAIPRPRKARNAPNATQSSASVQFATVSCCDSSTYSNVIFDRAPPGGRGPIPHRPGCVVRGTSTDSMAGPRRGGTSAARHPLRKDTLDQWSPFRLTAGELPSKIMSRLEGFGALAALVRVVVVLAWRPRRQSGRPERLLECRYQLNRDSALGAL